MDNDPYITIEKIADIIGITRDGVNYQIKKLKSQKRLERIDGDYVGHWKVIKEQ